MILIVDKGLNSTHGFTGNYSLKARTRLTFILAPRWDWGASTKVSFIMSTTISNEGQDAWLEGVGMGPLFDWTGECIRCKPVPAYAILTTYRHIIIHPQRPNFDIDPLCISPCLTVHSTSYICHLMYGYISFQIPVDSLIVLPSLPCLLLLQWRSIYSLSTYIIVSYSCNKDYSIVPSVCLSLSVGLWEHTSLPLFFWCL